MTELMVHVPARSSSEIGRGIGVALINYNTTAQTLRCLESLRRLSEAPDWVVVLDNASADHNLCSAISQFSPYDKTDLRLYHSSTNTGFAGGSNILIGELLANPACRYVVLLNNDAVAMPRHVERLIDAVSFSPGAGMAGGRMHKLNAPAQVDTLGIVLYASLMPADRHVATDPYLGPTGGCMAITRDCLEDLRQVIGYWFDARFFCYCEDTDLVLRTNLLGYRPVFVDEILALHEGQSSTGRGYSRFIAYHGIRNSVWMTAKSIPARLFFKYGLLLLLAHLMTIGRHLCAGSPGLLFEVYRDALGGRPER